MMSGKVKWFDPAKRLRFIVLDDGSRDIFVHGNALADRLVELQPDDRVEFLIQRDRQGRSCASDVRRVERTGRAFAEARPADALQGDDENAA